MDIEYKRVTKAFAREFFKLGDEYGFHVFSAIGNSGGSVELMLEGLNLILNMFNLDYARCGEVYMIDMDGYQPDAGLMADLVEQYNEHFFANLSPKYEIIK